MAAVNMYVHFKDTPRPDGLCPTCHNPALKLYHLQRLDWNGLTIIATRLACTDCKTFVGPTTPIKEHTQ